MFGTPEKLDVAYSFSLLYFGKWKSSFDILYPSFTKIITQIWNSFIVGEHVTDSVLAGVKVCFSKILACYTHRFCLSDGLANFQI